MVKNLPACSIPGWGRSLGEGNGYPLQYSCLENPVDRGSGQATACGVRESQTRLSTDTHTHIHPLNPSKPHWLRASDICIFHSQGWGQVQLGSRVSVFLGPVATHSGICYLWQKHQRSKGSEENGQLSTFEVEVG